MVKKNKAETADTVEEAEKSQEPKVEKAAPEKKDGFFVYIGPSIRGQIQNGSVYGGTRADVEALLAGAIEKHPRIKKLIVSGDTLPEDRINVKTPGNYLYENYRKLVSELK